MSDEAARSTSAPSVGGPAVRRASRVRTISVDIDISDLMTDIDDDDLIDELAARGKTVSDFDTMRALERSLPWLREQAGVPTELRDLVYDVLGKVL